MVHRTVNACLRVHVLMSEHKKTPTFKPFGDSAHVNLNGQRLPRVIFEVMCWKMAQNHDSYGLIRPHL